MEGKLFYKSDKGLSDEDWYYYVEGPNDGETHVIHKWSHGGPFNFKSDEIKYSIEEFKKEKPNQYRRLIRWLDKQDTN